jgi:hypothetical protein
MRTGVDIFPAFWSAITIMFGAATTCPSTFGAVVSRLALLLSLLLISVGIRMPAWTG